ncbi:hypothetical protein ACO0KY_14240 [Undibacterium sp. Dicai25W]|uniref:hypothetical protein n=1 Tax=Undibacterium sp. Dicai25W TaxID=3413034 RepID=UPI003BF0E29E
MTLIDLASFVFQQISISHREAVVRMPVKNIAPLYHIRTTFRDDDIQYVETLVRQSLVSIGGTIERFDYISQDVQGLAVFDIEVRCAENVRNHLVQMVSRLGLEGSVRSIRWSAAVGNGRK